MPLAPTGDWALVGHPTDRDSAIYLRRALKTGDAPMGNLAPRARRPWSKVGFGTTYSDEDMSQLMERDGLIPLFPGIRYSAFTQEEIDGDDLDRDLDDLLAWSPSEARQRQARERIRMVTVPTGYQYPAPSSDFMNWLNVMGTASNGANRVQR